MTTHLMRSFFVALLIGLALPMQGWAQAARVAVIGDPSLNDLVDLTTAQLSTVPDVSVLERADLNKLGQEQALQAVVGSNDFTPVQMVPADGLVILRAVKQDGKIGVFARLVAVQPGIVLRETALPDGADPAAQANAIAQEFAAYWPKLTAIQKGKVSALSLLGLRFEVDAPETRDLERSFNILLASRLSAEPSVVVLERWRLNDAAFEKSLTPRVTSAFWTGSSLIDGSMKWDKSTSRIDVAMRVRPPQGAEISIKDADTAQNLPALIERLAGKIDVGAVTSAAWAPADEARRFTDLGRWCLDNGLAKDGAEAEEAALALGLDNRATRLLRVSAYAMQAYPAKIGSFRPIDDDFREGIVPPNSVPESVTAGAMAATLMSDFLEENPDDPGLNGSLIFFNCARALRAAYDAGYQARRPDDVADLRHAIQRLVTDLDGRLVTAPESLGKLSYLRHEVYYAGLWNETPEATLAFYRKRLDPKSDYNGIRASLYQFDVMHRPFLDDDASVATDQEMRLIQDAPNFLGPPYLVAWDDRSAKDLKATWREFLNELGTSPEVVLQADALKLELKTTVSDAGRNACVARMASFLQVHAADLSGPQGPLLASGIGHFFFWMERQDNAEARQQMTALYLALLKQHAELPPNWIDAGTKFFYGTDKVTTVEAAQLLAALDDYAAWYGKQAAPDQRCLRALAETRQIFLRAKPELQAAPSEQTDALAVDRFWGSAGQGLEGTTHSSSLPVLVSPESLTIAENQVWFMTTHPPYQICAVDPATLQTVANFMLPEEMISRETPGRLNIQSLAVSPQWLATGVDDKFFICSRADMHWQQLDLPPFIYKPRFLNGELYLTYRPAFVPSTNQSTAQGTGLIHVVLPAGTIENVVSSRRVPPQTALDGKALGTPLGVWMSPGGLTLGYVTDNPAFATYISPLGKNAWTNVFSAPSSAQVRPSQDGALMVIGKNRDFLAQISFMNATQDRLLLVDPDFAGVFSSRTPEWNFPNELRGTAWGNIAGVSAIMRGEELCLYRDVRNGQADGREASLYYFAQGRKDAVKIPLAFDLETMKQARPGWLQKPTPALNFDGLQATDYGLVIYGVGDPGLWVIPWSDIDAYRAKRGALPAGGVASPVNAKGAPAPVGISDVPGVISDPAPAPAATAAGSPGIDTK